MELDPNQLLNMFPTRSELENYKIITTRRIDELEEQIKILEGKINERKEYKQTRKSNSNE